MGSHPTLRPCDVNHDKSHWQWKFLPWKESADLFKSAELLKWPMFPRDPGDDSIDWADGANQNATAIARGVAYFLLPGILTKW